MDCNVLYIENMKKLIIAIFLAAGIVAQAQDVAYLSFAPEDNAIGIRADIDGGYMSISYGNYRLPYGGHIKDHTKIAMGFVYKHYTLGVSYHSFGETKETVELTKMSLKPISIEAGVRVFVNDWFVAALRYDVLRHEGMVDFGICFGK